MVRSVLSMTWRDVLFAHWAVPPATLRSHLPESLEPATYDGDAYVGVVAMEMADVRPTGFPVGRTFPELNLRTYVREADPDARTAEGRGDEGSEDTVGDEGSEDTVGDEGSEDTAGDEAGDGEGDGRQPLGDPDVGVYFFSLDAADSLGVGIARSAYDLPYYRARMRLRRDGDEVRFASRRVHRDAPPAHFAATYRPDGEASTPDPGSLEAFLTEHYRFYVAGDALFAGDIDHEPWTLAPATAEIQANTLFDAAGLDRPDGDPVYHVARDLDVTAGWLAPVHGERACLVDCGDWSEHVEDARAEADDADDGPVVIDV